MFVRLLVDTLLLSVLLGVLGTYILAGGMPNARLIFGTLRVET